MMKTMGWFQNFKTLVLAATVALSAGISAQSWALNIDFEKELKKREIVSVRLSDEIGSRKDANSQKVTATSGSGAQGEDLDLNPDRETETFSVQLKAISR